MMNLENVYTVNITDLSVFNDLENSVKLDVIHKYNGEYGLTEEYLKTQIVKGNLKEIVIEYIGMLIGGSKMSLNIEHSDTREELLFTDDDTLTIQKEYENCFLVINVKGIYDDLRKLQKELLPYTYKK